MKKNRNIVLITGGAGFIGTAVSEEMAQLNSDLILVDINKKNLDTLKNKLCSKYDCKVDVFNCDMSNTNELSSLVSKISNKYKRIDTIINSVGMVGTDKMKGWNTDFDNQDIEAWQKCLDINLSSIFSLFKNYIKK